MAALWYCYLNSQQHGPLSLAQLQQWAASGHLKPDDHVRTAEQAQWSLARDVPQLFAATLPPVSGAIPPVAQLAPLVLPAQPPSAPPMAIDFSSASPRAPSPARGRRPQNKQSFAWGSAIVCGVLAALAGIGRIAQLAVRNQEAAEAREKEERARIKRLRPPRLPPSSTPPRPEFDPNKYSAQEQQRKLLEEQKKMQEQQQKLLEKFR